MMDSLPTAENSFPWALERKIGLSFFASSKEIMYRDLDPDKWDLAKLFRNNLFTTALGYPLEKNTDSSSLKEEHDGFYYRDPIRTIVPADSSQMEAISMALKQKPMVIQGPPGTGKSQTITNLIGSSIAKGLKVLFVAEKNEALSVVASRLEEVGLDNYCLELHSQKATPKHFSGQLSNRLGQSSQSSQRDDTASTLEILEQLKNENNSYGLELNKIQITKELYHIFWEREKNYTLISKIPKFKHRLKEDIQEFLSYNRNQDEIDSRKVIEEVERISKLWSEGVLHHSSYWKDFSPWKSLMPTDSDILKKIFIKQQDILKEIEILHQANAGFPESIFTQIATLLNIVNKDSPISCLPSRPDDFHCDILQEMSDQNRDFSYVKRIIQFIVDSKSKINEIWSQEHSLPFKQVFKQRGNKYELITNPDDLDSGIKILTLLTSHSIIAGNKIEDLSENLSLLKKYEHNLKALLEEIDHLRKIIGTKTTFSQVSNIKYLVGFCKTFVDTSLNHANVTSAVTKDLLQDFKYERARNITIRECEEIHNVEKTLTQFFRTPSDLTNEDISFLENELVKLSNSFWKYPLWGDSKKAKKLAKNIAVDRKLILDPEWIKSLNTASKWLSSKQKFKNNISLKTDLGPTFNGYETDWIVLDKAKDLIETLQEVFTEDSESIVTRIEEDAFDYDEIVFTIKKIDLLLNSLENEELLAILTESPKLDFSTLDLATCASNSHELQSKLHSAIEKLECFELLKDQDYADFTINLKDCHNFVLSHIDLANTALNYSDILALSIEKIDIGCSEWSSTNLNKILSTLDYISQIVSVYGLSATNTAYSYKISNNNCDINAQSLVNSLRVQWTNYLQNLARIEEQFATIDQSSIHSSDPYISEDLSWLKELYSAWEVNSSSFENLPRWSDYSVSKNALVKYKCIDILNFCEDRSLSAIELRQFTELVMSDALCRKIMQQNPLLANTRRIDLEAYLTKYREMEESLPSEFQQDIIRELNILGQNVIEGNNRGKVREKTEMSLIRNEATKGSRHLQIRHVISQSKVSLQHLFPCWMMSPSSIAKFCNQEDIRFDLLIMDEASQMKPEDCLGAFARSDSAVIVGDIKQMPPSSAFTTKNTTSFDDDSEEDNIESILEKALECFPETTLKWHYRSKHQDLIKFSNLKYYKEALIIPPSTHEKHPTYGINWNYLEDATCVKSINSIEADAVTNAMVEHIVDQATINIQERKSVGVVVMNSTQATLVRKILDKKKLDDPDFRDAWENFHDSGMPKAIIVNLERVQGDERDKIIIGFTYGPSNLQGPVARRFGPFNKKGGYRRLNVLITRAKESMDIYSSMTSEQILGGTDVTNPNIRDLADFLRYAATGKLVDHGVETSKDFDSPFEEAVARVVSSMGYEVVPQVGVAGFRIDLGIRKLGRHDFICGIECDGATYHSHPITRDRDVLRQSVLEARGWNIYRIWSTDWFRNRDSEMLRLKKYLNQQSS